MVQLNLVNFCDKAPNHCLMFKRIFIICISQGYCTLDYLFGDSKEFSWVWWHM